MGWILGAGGGRVWRCWRGGRRDGGGGDEAGGGALLSEKLRDCS